MVEPIPTVKFERLFWQSGVDRVAGVDEVGRGAWAGPVVAGAVVLPQVRGRAHLRTLAAVRDSKLLSPAEREELYAPICEAALSHSVGMATCEEIDMVGIVEATRRAMQRALACLTQAPQALLIDALELPSIPLPQKAIIHGDQQSLSIACASVLAKVTRDRLMVEMDARFPGYGFARHKGYGTIMHWTALQMLGACSEHRRSFAPIAGLGF